MDPDPSGEPSPEGRHHLGVDAGGTSTRAVVLTPDGRCLGHGRAGSGNPISSGPAHAGDSLHRAVSAALVAAGLSGATVVSTSVAMAGGSSVTDDSEAGAAIHGAVARAGVTTPVTMEQDLLALYFSGSPDPDGHSLVAGTGAAAVRVEGGEVVATCDGLGWLLGDDGSGFWIGQQVARAVGAALDGRSPDTALTALLLTALEVTDGPSDDHASAAAATVPGGHQHEGPLHELVKRLYALPPVHLARFAPLAFEAADTGDAVAADIVERAGRALATTLGAVLRPEAGPHPVVLGGSVLVAQPAPRTAVRASLVAAGHTGEVIVVPDGLVGAAVLSLRRAGLAVDRSVFETVTTTLAALR
ncbi:N-acetylglucosamine kinase [Terracoccus luteus]|uniref:N-acetylglucosamine kinase-like BadF-type ATPase n=1 Tax=Terracoccus luteus TaxID=53356 RepID=A0A839PXY4_9MICO|nr:BadF/BadG/BcrA/BcrD ATPase family protein [Terracoccus luteus]MBB2986836.1 N-acetylglucosamine kinase-like BadF-type ATPase [Terracoccus luteus]MCP2172487.1 N-acetylglucosamine kinase-like BadF-type ATPase [Terracoccus luteus]